MLGPSRSAQQGVLSMFGVLLYSYDGAADAPGPSGPLRLVQRKRGHDRGYQ
jgi:hypothetical protein